MRIEITHSSAVHTSKGRKLSKQRVTLPREEAEQIIANGHAVEVDPKAEGKDSGEPLTAPAA